MVKTIGQVAEYWLSDPQARARTAGQPRPRLSRSVGRRGQAHGRRRERRRRPRPTRRTSALPIRNGRRTSSSISSSRPICSPTQWAEHLVKDAARRRPAHPRQGRVLRQADRQRDLAVEFRADQSGAAARDAVVERREPGARHAHAGRGHQGRRRQSAASASPTPRCSRSAAISRSRPARSIFQNDLMQLIQYEADDRRRCSRRRC